MHQRDVCGSSYSSALNLNRSCAHSVFKSYYGCLWGGGVCVLKTNTFCCPGLKTESRPVYNAQNNESIKLHAKGWGGAI